MLINDVFLSECYSPIKSYSCDPREDKKFYTDELLNSNLPFFSFLKVFKFILCVGVLCFHVCMWTMYVQCLWRPEKKVLNALELESWGVMCMLGTEPGFSAEAASILNC